MPTGDVGSTSLPDTAQFITFKVPVKAIAPLVPDIGALIARRVPHDCQPLRLLVRYLGALQEEGAFLTTPRMGEGTEHSRRLWRCPQGRAI
jgi:hypothetical protein